MNGRSIIMTANASARAIKPELLRTYTEDFNKDRANLIAADAAVSAGVLKAATDYRGVRALPRDFSIELKQGSITNQERSGRCWMFASLNTLRYELMHRWNLEDFEFSETYLFFWDAMEKSNTYLENVLRTLDEATDSRLFEAINESPADDGGWWQMFAALVNKYGLVPKSAYPESENSRNSDDFKQYLNSKLREFAAELRRRSAAGASEDELRALKDEYMGTVYRICAVALGEPPEKFDFFARPKDDDEDKKGEARKCKAEADADGKAESCKCGESCKCEGKSDAKACKCDKDKSDKPKTGKDERPQIREIGITPLEFYKKYVPVDVNDFVTLANARSRTARSTSATASASARTWPRLAIWNSSTCRWTCSRRPRLTSSPPATRSGSPATARSSPCARTVSSTSPWCASTSCSAPNSPATRPTASNTATARATTL